MDVFHLITLLLTFEHVFAETEKYYSDFGYVSIEPGDTVEVLKQDRGIFPGSHQNVILHDIGRTHITGTFRYGTQFGIIGDITSYSIYPGSKHTYVNGGRPYYVTNMRISNSDKSVRAIVYGEFTNGGSDGGKNFPLDINTNNLLRYLTSKAISYIPKVGDMLSAVVQKFWPEEKPSIWEEIKDKVKSLVDDKVQDAINGILEGDIAQYKARLETLTEEMNKKNNTALHYMAIALSFIGFEKKFIFSQGHADYKKINYLLLPLYSSVIQMKMMFYTIGIIQAKKIGLDDEHINDIENYSKKLLHDGEGAINYIRNMYKERVDHTYATGRAGAIFDLMMTVRSYIAVNGLEYFANWEHMLLNPTQPKIPYNNVLVYSNFHGRQTKEMARMAIIENAIEPLAPVLISGRRNKITKVEVYMWAKLKSKIGGLKVHFEIGPTYMMGGTSDEIYTIEWNGAKLMKLTTSGGGALDELIFEFSDGRVFKLGWQINPSKTVFELPNHHIVGIFLTNDSFATAHQASSIAVSYQSTEGSDF
ncbi:unnamed protein product [Brassicogethes aeneus]|uniref:Pesticidal crystal protein domain-containing protein n=1 Tax=Brassicogethes aeneus TaxID=1431903 RepID=A0A9P0B2B9_BRAAE|nr:unnamed protein product [Brassicogethes aeneus]